MRVGLIQMSPGSDKQQNVEQARGLIEACVSNERPDILVLPEMWTCLGGDRNAKLLAAESLPAINSGQEGGAAFEFLRQVAIGNRIHVHGGSIGERKDDKLLNTSIIFSPSGSLLARYSKIHLFDVTTPAGTSYHESELFQAGENVVTVDLQGSLSGTRIGLAICYDLRFGELFYHLRKAGANLIVLPAAFTAETGEAHWEVLLRARAIDTQCWLAAAGTTGLHQDGAGRTKTTYGNSMIIDPWGAVTARVSSGPGWAVGRVDTAKTEQIRTSMPVMDHRRLM